MEELYDKYFKAMSIVGHYAKIANDLQRPLTKDTTRMADLWSKSEGEVQDTRLAVMLRIFSPRTLLSGRSVERGVVRPLSVVSGLSRTHVSKLCHDIHFRYRSQPRLRQRVELLAEKIFTR